MSRPLFDGAPPERAGAMARDRGLRLVGLSQVYLFNDGPVFFECTAPTVHGMTDAGAAIRRSMELIAEASAAA